MVGTPQSMNNIFYDYYQKAQTNKNGFCTQLELVKQELSIKKNWIMHLPLWEKLNSNKNLNVVLLVTPGSIYGDIISDLEDKKQLTTVPYDPSYLVHTAWDLGWKDDTTIVFFQEVGHSINIIDCYANRNQALPHYVEIA